MNEDFSLSIDISEFDFTMESRIEIIPENYHDRYGKAGITDPEVFIYACDENLSNYLRETIHTGMIDTGFKILPFDEVRPFINSVPIYDISVAAGNFSDTKHKKRAPQLLRRSLRFSIGLSIGQNYITLYLSFISVLPFFRLQTSHSTHSPCPHNAV